MKQTNSIKTIVLAGLSVLMSVSFYANNEGREEQDSIVVEEASNTEEQVPSKFNPVETILEHIQDANEWHVATTDENSAHPNHISIPLQIGRAHV